MCSLNGFGASGTGGLPIRNLILEFIFLPSLGDRGLTSFFSRKDRDSLPQLARSDMGIQARQMIGKRQSDRFPSAVARLPECRGKTRQSRLEKGFQDEQALSHLAAVRRCHRQ